MAEIIFMVPEGSVFTLLVEDTTTGGWLFTNSKGERMKSIKKGFTAARVRTGSEDLRPDDLRHTFAIRLLDRGVHQSRDLRATRARNRRSLASAMSQASRPAMHMPRGKRWLKRSKLLNTLQQPYKSHLP